MKKSTEGEEWLWGILPEISRTFAFTIPHLPDDVARDLAVSYAICRVIDSVEDCRLDHSEKRETLDSFLEALRKPGDRKVIQNSASILGKVPTEIEYRRLLDEVPILFAIFSGLHSKVRGFVLDNSREMIEGLSDRGVQTIETIEDQNRYCHYAAGLVGHLITRVFSYRGHIPASRKKSMMQLGHDFGLALQKINILKDFRQDISEGRFYWPSLLVELAGLSYERLLCTDGGDRGKFSGLVGYLLRDVRAYFSKGFQYIDGLPYEPSGLRVFCGDNLLFAIATSRVLGSDDFFYGVNKISREEVQRIHESVERVVMERGDLRELGASLETKFS